MKRCAGWVGVALLSLIALLFGMSSISLWIGASERATEDSTYLQAFRQTAREVDRFRAQTGRLPHDREWEAIAHPSNKFPAIYIGAIDIEDASVASEIGPTPKNAYLLKFRRGEWHEYYATWSGKTTLLPTISAYRHAFLDELILYVGVATVSALAALWLRRWLSSTR